MKAKNKWTIIGFVVNDPTKQISKTASGESSLRVYLTVPRPSNKKVKDPVEVQLYGAEADEFYRTVNKGDCVQCVGEYHRNEGYAPYMGNAVFGIVKKIEASE